MEKQIRNYIKILDTSPDNVPAFDALVKIYQDNERWSELAGLYEEKAKKTGNIKQIPTLLFDAADIYSERLAKMEKVEDCYMKVLDTDPQNKKALKELKDRYRDGHKWDMLIHLLEQEAENSPDPDKSADCYTDIANLWEKELGNEEKKADFLSKAISVSDKHLPSIRQLKQHYLQSFRIDEALDLVEKEESILEKDKELVDMYLEVGMLLADDPFEKDRAIEYLKRALAINKKNKKAKAKINELESLDDKWRDLTKKYMENAINVSDKREASIIYAKIAGIYYLYSPDDSEEILSSIEKSMLLDSSNRRSLALGEKYLREREQWEKLVDFYKDIHSRARNDQFKADIMGKQAALYVEKMDNREEALSLYREVIQLNPDNLNAFRFVAEDLTAKENWDELRELLNDRLNNCNELAAKIDTYIQLSKLAKDQDSNIDEAIENLEKAFELDANNADAARELASLYEEQENWDKLKDIYPIVIGSTKDLAEKREFELKLADLLKTQLGDLEKAFPHYAEALLLDPEDEDTLAALEELTIDLENWETLVETLEKVLGQEEAPANWKKLKFTLGQIFDKELSLYDQAESCYKELIEKELDFETLDALGRLYSKDLRWDNLVEVFLQKAEITEDLEEKRDVMLERARIIEEEIMDSEAAISAYFDVLDVMEGELDALKSLEELLETAGRNEELAKVVTSELEVITSIPEKINLNFKLGNLYFNKLDDKDSAAKAYMNVLEVDNSHLPSIERLEELLGAGVLVNDIFRSLEEYYRRLERWDKLATGYEALEKSEEDELKKGEYCHKLADIYQTNRSMSEEAYEWIKKGMATPYQESDFLKLSLETARKLGKQNELLELLEEKVESIEEKEQKIDMHLALGDLYWDGMQDAEQAEKHLKIASDEDPENSKVLEAFCIFAEATEEWDVFIEFSSKLAANIDDKDRKKEILFKASDIAGNKLDDYDAAMDLLKQVLSIDKKEMQAIDNLLDLQSLTEVWEDAVLTLLDKLELTEEGPERLEVKMRLARIYANHLEDFDEAAKLYSEVLADDPNHEDAFHEMERFLDQRLCEKKVADTLQPIYEEKRNFDKLIQVLTLQYEHEESDAAYQLAVRIASLYEEEISDYSSALEWYGKAFLSDKGFGLLKELMLSASEAGDYRRFVDIGEEKLESELPDEEKVELLTALADTEKGDLADSEAARSRYRQILEVEENESALDALVDLARDTEDTEDLADLLDKKRNVASEKSVRREVTLELADIRYKQLENTEEALSLLKELMEERENDPQVFEKMEAIYQSEERYEELKNLLDLRLKYLREDDDILPVKIQIGSLLENNLEQTEEAMIIYLDLVRNYWNYPVVGALVDRLLAQEETQLDIANEMEKKYIKTQDWKRLVQVHEIQLKYTDDQQEKAKLLEKLSSIYQDKLQDPEKAFEGFARVFIDDPQNESALDELEKLAGDLGSWKELAEVYEKAGEASEDTDEAVQLFIKAARLYEDILAFQEDSIRAYRKVLDRDRNDMTAIQALEGLCRKTERWEELRDIYLQRIELTDDLSEKKELYVNICILYEHQLEDPLGATEYYESILELTPHDSEVIDKLADLYTEAEDWAKKAELVGHKLTLTDSVMTQNELKIEKAVLHEDKLEDLTSAKDLYKSVLDADDENETALVKLEEYVEMDEFQDELARFLAPFYFKGENWNKHIDMEEYQFNHSEDDEERLALLKEIAYSYEHRLDQASLAYGVYTRAFRENALDEELREELERLAGFLGLFKQLGNLYEEEIASLSPEDDKDALITLLLNLGHIVETHLGEIEEAAGHYRWILDLDEHHLEALKLLERIYNTQSKWPELITILETKSSITEDLEQNKSILFKIANIHEDELSDNLKAIETYNRILELDAKDFDVLKALVRLTTAEKQWDDLIATRQMQLDIAEGEEQVWDIRHKIGLVLWEEQDKTEEAIDVFESIITENHSYMDSREALEIMLDDDDAQLRSAKILEPIYAEEERWESFIGSLDIQAKHAEVGEEKKDLFIRMATLAENNLANENRAFDYTVSAFDNDTANMEIRERMERLAASVDRFADLAGAYRNQAEKAEEVDAQVDLYLNAGRVTLRNIDDPASAESFYAAVRVRQADNLKALDALEEIFERTEQWPELVDVYFTKADLFDEADVKIDLYTKSAEVREQKLEDKPEAIDCYLLALDVDENHMPALLELDRLYLEQDKYEELTGILSRREALTEDRDERLAYTFRRGQVVEDKLEKPDEALTIYKSILDENDEMMDAIESIEQLVMDTDNQNQALEILVPLFEAKEWFERLADIYEVQIETLTDSAVKIDVLDRIKVIYEQELTDANRAFQIACRIFQEDYHNHDARQEMERLAVVTGGFEGLVSTYASFYAQIQDKDLKIEIQTKIARINEEQLQRDEDAVDSYRAVLDLEPENFTAIFALDRLYERLERYTDLVELIPREFEMLDDPKEITELRLRLAKLWDEKLEDRLTAIDVYRQVIENNPDHPVALSALERLYEQEEQWESLIGTYKAEVRIARGDTKKARLYSKMAQVLSDKMDKAKEAIPLWNRVLQFDENNSEVMDHLEALYSQEQMWEELVTHYKKRLRGARGAEDRALVTKHMAQLYRDKLGQEDRSTQLFLKVLEYTPRDLEVIDTLEEIYLKNKSWRELVDLLQRLLTEVDGPELRSLYLRLSSIQIEHLGNPAEGERLARQVLDMEPTVEELARLEQEFRDLDNHELYLAILEQQTVVAEDEQDLVALYFRMAEIHSDKLDNKDKAKECFEKVLSVSPGNLQAAEQLEPIYESAELWSELIGVLQIRLTEAYENDEKNELNRRMASIYADKMDDTKSAFDALAEVFKLEPSDLELLTSLEAYADKIENHLDLARILRNILPEVQHNAKLNRVLILKVAEIYENKAVNEDLAAEFYKMFLEAGEYNEHAVDYLVSYYEGVEDWEELVLAYQQKIAYMSQEEKVVIGCRVASIFHDHLDQTGRSVKTYQQVLKMDETCMEAIDGLIGIYEEQEDWSNLVEQLRHKLHFEYDAEKISSIRMRIAGLYHQNLENPKEAKVFYRAIIAENPKHTDALDQLENIYETEENYDELLEVLSRRVNVTEEDENKLALYRKMAEIWETKFEQRDMAVNYLEKMLAIMPNNMEAITTLERIYRESGDWPSLAATYQRHIDQTIDAEEIVGLYTEMGRIYGDYLFRPSEAIENFSKALKIDEENHEVLAALSELYISNEKWQEGIETLERMATLAKDKTQKVEALSRLGRIYLENLNDPAKAKEVYDRMIDEDPTFVPALRALRQYYAATEDWDAFLKIVDEEKRYVEDDREKAELLYEEGKYYHELKHDVDHAVTLYREALDLSDDLAPVLKVLGHIYFERQEWTEAKNNLSKLLELEAELEHNEKARINYQLAYVAEQAEEDSDALKHYTIAYKLDSNNLLTLEGLARTLYKREDWDRAFRVYQTILVRFRDQKSVPELVEVFCRLGEVNGKLGKNDVAVRMYEKALELDSESVRAIKAIIFFYESLENWKKVLKYRSRLIKILSGDELFDQWKAIGDVYSDKLDDQTKGLEAYRFALEVKANDSELLTRVSDLLINSGQLDDAIGVLKSAVLLESDETKLLALNLKLADLLKENSDDPESCLVYYNAALDLMPYRTDIFDTIENFLTEKESWDKLDESYRLMITRIPQDDVQKRLTFWKKLGTLLSDKAGNLEEAIQAWEVVAGLDPEDMQTQEHIADLYARSPEYREQAIGMHRTLLERDPKRVNSYRALWKIHFEAEEFDKAFCFAAIVDYLGEKQTPAAEFYRENMQEVKQQAYNMLDRQLWGTLLLHEDARHNVGQILNILFHHVNGLMPSNLKKEGLKKKNKLDLSENINFSITAQYISKTLGSPMPDIYTKNGWGPGIEPLAIQPAAIAIGSDAFENFPQRDLTFLIAKNIVLARPDFSLATILDAKKVKNLLDAATLSFDSRFGVEGDLTAVKALKKKIDKGVPKKVREPLSGFVSEYSQMVSGFDVEKWQRSIFVSAYRAGLLMSGDLPKTIELLHKDKNGFSDEQVADIENDLVAFSISEQYFHLRNYLGFSIV